MPAILVLAHRLDSALGDDSPQHIRVVDELSRAAADEFSNRADC